MASSGYSESVAAFLEEDGWRVSTTELREGVAVLAGSREGGSGTLRSLTMVVERPESSVTAEHLKFLLRAGREKEADRLQLTTTLDLSQDVVAACENNDIAVLKPQTVRSSTGQGFDAGTDDISMPAANQGGIQPGGPGQSPRTGREREGESPPAGGEGGGQPPRAGSERESQPRGQQSVAGTPRTHAQPPNGPAESESVVNRRGLLVGAVGLAAVLGGGWLVFGSGDSGTSGGPIDGDGTGNGDDNSNGDSLANTPTAVTEASFEAYANGNQQRFDELSHDQTPNGDVPQDGSVEFTSVEATVLQENPNPDEIRDSVPTGITPSYDPDNIAQIVANAEDAAVVRVEASGTDEGQTRDLTATYVLATEGGQWRILSPLEWTVA